jgi:hypothetical protein
MGYYGSRAGIMDQNDKDKIGLVVGALKARDAAKAQNQANMLGAITGGLNLLGSGLGSGGFFTKLRLMGVDDGAVGHPRSHDPVSPHRPDAGEPAECVLQRVRSGA